MSGREVRVLDEWDPEGVHAWGDEQWPCRAVGPNDSWICTRIEGHDGEHRAAGERDVWTGLDPVFAAWDNEDES